ncbi:MAG: hypothetical protein GQ534_06415 [Candidatus Delongbacteria bacterium]|nr:hypothetical protein [Candidatus Delongbacteria bacterium]
MSENYLVVTWNTSTTSGGGGGGGGGNGGGGGGSGTVVTSNYNFATKLYPDGKIEFFYGDNFPVGNYLPSGISNGSELSTCLSVVYNTWDPTGLKTAFSTTPFPYGIQLSNDGVFSGTILPTNETSWDLTFRVIDNNNFDAIKVLPFSLVNLSAILTAPQNIVTNIKATSALISWDQVLGSTLYHIYRSTDPYSGFVEIGTSSTLSFEDTEALVGNKYFYYVTADNSK